MENIFFLVIDAFCYDNLNRKIGGEYTCPFLRRLAANNISYTNMYSQAPYTEASLVSLLTGKNTLDGGGYIFGNKCASSSVFTSFKKKGYKVIASCSPSTYTISRLNNVDDYFYTAPVNYNNLLTYRFSYYRDKYINKTINNDDYLICEVLLDEEFETWMNQINQLINRDDKCALLLEYMDLDNVNVVKKELLEEIKKYEQDKKVYIDKIFMEFRNHKMSMLAKKYRQYPHYMFIESLKKIYYDSFLKISKIYSSFKKKYLPNPFYLLNTLLVDKKLHQTNFRQLMHQCKYYRNNDFLMAYLDHFSCEPKGYSSMKRQFDTLIQKVNLANRERRNVVTYIHVDDFHLPSMIHSFDYDNYDYISDEIKDAIMLASKIDKHYKGNLLADLSARYCDNKVKYFFNALKNKYGDNFKLVVTADHGFPSYYNPPRPYIYNQTYTEAFHVPFIIYDNNKKAEISKFRSLIDAYRIIDNYESDLFDRDYILAEYGGPGCPHISERPLWYTYIDSKYRISVECSLNEQVTVKSIKAIHRIDRDKNEQYNLVIFPKGKRIINIMNTINKRHMELSSLYKGKLFYEAILKEKY